MILDNKLTVILPDGSPYTLYEAFPKQAAFHQSDVSRLVAIGSRNSGKSLMLRMDAHMRALSCPGANLILIRKSYKELMKSHVYFQGLPWGSLKREMELLGGTFHATDYICHYPNGSKLFLSYVGHESDALNLLSAEFTAAYFDEISTIPWDFFVKLCSSVRVKKGLGIKAVIRGATNPFGVSAGEVQSYFVNKDVDPEEDPDYYPNDWDHIRIDMQDNPHIDLEEYKRQLAPLPPHLKKAWIEGEFSDEEALFNFSPTKAGQPYHIIHDIDLQSILKNARIFRAFDWGWHPDPSYCLWVAHLGNRYIAFHEKVWYRTIIPDLAQAIKEEEKYLGIRDDDLNLIKAIPGSFCDPTLDINTGAEIRTNRQIFEDNGIPMEPSINNRELYASSIHHALAEEVELGEGKIAPKLQIYKGTSSLGCPYLVRALPLMRMNPKKVMAMADHKHDHPVVTLAYFLMSQNSNEFHQYNPQSIPRWLRPKREEKSVLGNENVRN